jgi:putative hydrolase of the HAD superfamily
VRVVPLPAPREVLLLDAGNTVVFFDEDAAVAALTSEGVRLDPSAVRAAQGPARRDYEARLAAGASHDDGWFVHMQSLLRHAGAPAERAPELARALRRAHDELNLWRRVPTGLAEALAQARAAGIRLGIVSNSEGHIAELLSHVGLAELFEVVVDSGVEGVSKPDPEIWHRALDRMGARAGDALYAGDVPSVDVDGARRAGLEAVLVDAYDHYADYTSAARVRSVADLLDVWLR